MVGVLNNPGTNPEAFAEDNLSSGLRKETWTRLSEVSSQANKMKETLFTYWKEGLENDAGEANVYGIQRD